MPTWKIHFLDVTLQINNLMWFVTDLTLNTVCTVVLVCFYSRVWALSSFEVCDTYIFSGLDGPLVCSRVVVSVILCWLLHCWHRKVKSQASHRILNQQFLSFLPLLCEIFRYITLLAKYKYLKKDGGCLFIIIRHNRYKFISK